MSVQTVNCLREMQAADVAAAASDAAEELEHTVCLLAQLQYSCCFAHLLIEKFVCCSRVPGELLCGIL